MRGKLEALTHFDPLTIDSAGDILTERVSREDKTVELYTCVQARSGKKCTHIFDKNTLKYPMDFVIPEKDAWLQN